MADRRVLTLQQVAQYLQVHRNTVYRLARKGILPAFKVGSDWRFNRESIDSWRLSQERSRSADRVSAESTPLEKEILQILSWYVGEGLGHSMSLHDIQRISNRRRWDVLRALNRLRESGDVDVGPDDRYRLTRSGALRGQERHKKLRERPSGHASVLDFATRESARLGGGGA